MEDLECPYHSTASSPPPSSFPSFLPSSDQLSSLSPSHRPLYRRITPEREWGREGRGTGTSLPFGLSPSLSSLTVICYRPDINYQHTLLCTDRNKITVVQWVRLIIHTWWIQCRHPWDICSFPSFSPLDWYSVSSHSRQKQIEFAHQEIQERIWRVR